MSDKLEGRQRRIKTDQLPDISTLISPSLTKKESSSVDGRGTTGRSKLVYARRSRKHSGQR